jgi:hypothetical protein
MLQLGVIGYGTISRFFDAAAEVAEVGTPAQPLATLSDLDVVDVSPEPEADTVVLPRIVNAPESAAVRTSRRQVVTRPAIRTFETDFRPVTITVPTPSPYSFAAYEPQAPRTETPKTQTSDAEPLNYVASSRSVDVRNKRGFMAKTFTVIKKPYDWMKAVGSKLK